MAEIIQRLFAYVPNQAMRIGGEQFTRSLGVLNTWSRIRLGLLCAAAPNGTANITSNFTFGICNGQTNAGGSAVCSSAFGAAIPGSQLASSWTWSYQANSLMPYYASSGSGKLFRRSLYQLAESAGNINAMALPLYGTGSQKRRVPIYLDITRNQGGGGLATVAIYAPSGSQVTVDYRPDQFLDGLDQVGVPTVNGNSLAALLSTTFALSDMLGALDTLFVMWQNAEFPLEVYAIGASIIRELDYLSGAGGCFDSFQTYGVGTVSANLLADGSGFSAVGKIAGTNATQSNPAATSGWAGTSAGWPYDSFESYTDGTIGVGGTITLNAGLGWAGNGSIY